MELEKEISQESFVNEYHKLIVNLIYSNSWLISHLKRFFGDHELTIQQFNILRILRGQHPKPASINLLRERMLDKMSDASRIVERLRIKGMLERNPSRQDRRAVEVIITQKGLEILENIDQKNRYFDELIDALSQEEAREMNYLLDKMRN